VVTKGSGEEGKCQADEIKLTILPRQSGKLLKTLKAKCREHKFQFGVILKAKCRGNPEHGTPAVALTQPFSSEAL